jgi:hypothetical protein
MFRPDGAILRYIGLTITYFFSCYFPYPGRSALYVWSCVMPCVAKRIEYLKYVFKILKYYSFWIWNVKIGIEIKINIRLVLNG